MLSGRSMGRDPSQSQYLAEMPEPNPLKRSQSSYRINRASATSQQLLHSIRSNSQLNGSALRGK